MRYAFVASLLLCIWPVAVQATGWNDYKFDLNEKYYVLKGSAINISIGGYQQVTHPTGLGGDVGPLFELYNDKNYLFAKCHGFCYPRGRQRLPDVDPAKTYYFLVDKSNDEVFGPASQAEFEARVMALGVTLPIPWLTLRQAYKKSLREGGAHYSQLDIAFLGQCLAVAFLSPIIAFHMTWISLIVAIPLYFIKCPRKKPWPFGKCWFFSWISLLLLIVLGMVGISFANWLDMQFL